MKLIPLTQNKFAIVDDFMFDFLNKHKWYYHKGRKCKDYQIGYAKRWIKTQKGKGIDIRMANIIMHEERENYSKLHGIPVERVQIDFINNNTLDLRMKNLRCCTNSQNQMNRKDKKGFTYRSSENVYIVKIATEPNKMTYIGRCRTEGEARNLYNHYAKIFYGEFAKLVPVKELIPFEKIKVFRRKPLMLNKIEKPE